MEYILLSIAIGAPVVVATLAVVMFVNRRRIMSYMPLLFPRKPNAASNVHRSMNMNGHTMSAVNQPLPDHHHGYESIDDKEYYEVRISSNKSVWGICIYKKYIYDEFNYMRLILFWIHLYLMLFEIFFVLVYQSACNDCS